MPLTDTDIARIWNYATEVDSPAGSMKSMRTILRSLRNDVHRLLLRDGVAVDEAAIVAGVVDAIEEDGLAQAVADELAARLRA